MPAPDAGELLKAAIEISEAAAAIPMRHFRSRIRVEDKADESPVTIADRETESFIRGALEKRFPGHAILGEEFGRSEAGGGVTWIVDPIDGTRSFISGHPLFGMLLGAMRDGVMAAGIIRMPALGECVSGARGLGAALNGAPVRCRPTTPLAEATVYINEAARLLQREPERFARLAAVGKLRRFSYDCYPFALLAMGQIDVVVDYDLQPYDYLPPLAVVEAAGGVMTDWRGTPLGLSSGGSVVAAASPELH
jgi:histidinol phosphatase-like enzyme (inositol monophosphatase family)